MQKKSGAEQLIYLFSKLPGLGSRSARRIVLHLLQDKEVRLKGLIQGLESAEQMLNICDICGNIDSANICGICLDENRNAPIIAIVETVAELWAIERSDNFTGKYHVLGKNLASASSRNPSELGLPRLLQRCIDENTQELIIATNATLDGQTTAYFITEFFKNHPITISRLASGIPIGGELDYLDEGTVSAALETRRQFG
jgi:recombination protein RecR